MHAAISRSLDLHRPTPVDLRLKCQTRRVMALVFLAMSLSTPAWGAPPVVAGGLVKSVSADGKQVLVTIGAGTSAREETLRVSAATKFTLDARPAKLADIKPAMKVTVTYDKLSKELASIKAVAQAAVPKADPTKETPARSGSPAPTSASAPSTAAAAADDATKTVAPMPVWTMDLAQMKIAAGKVSGKIHGQEFALEQAKLENNILTLGQGKDFFPDLSVKVFLFLKEGESLPGKTFRIASKSGFGNPHIHVNSKAKGGNVGSGKSDIFLDKYAMLLEFGKSAGGKLPGKIYLSLPDEAKSVVAGNFTVEVFDSTHPLVTGSSISGKITVRGSIKDVDITLGCVGKNQEGKLEGPGGGFKIGGEKSSATSTTWAPRNTTVSWDGKAGSHQHVNRPAGHYLVYVRGGTRIAESGGDVKYEGYHDWKWVELKDDKAKITVDLVIDPDNLGHIEVSLPAGRKERIVIFLPLDSEGKLPLPEALWYMSRTSSVNVEGDKAAIRGLREGKYQIALYDRLENPGTTKMSAEAVVEVKRGATTKVALNPPPPSSTSPAPAQPPKSATSPPAAAGGGASAATKPGHLSSYSKTGGNTGWGYRRGAVEVDGIPLLEGTDDRVFGADHEGKLHPVFTIKLPDPLTTTDIRLKITGTKARTVSIFELEA